MLKSSYYSYFFKIHDQTIDKSLEIVMYKRPKFRPKIFNGNYACGIFVDFQQPFDKVDHHMLLKILQYYGFLLQYYGFRAILNKWFALYLSNRPQFVSINGFKWNRADVKCGCLKFPYRDLLCFSFTLMIYMKQLSLIKYTTLQIILTFWTLIVM